MSTRSIEWSCYSSRALAARATFCRCCPETTLEVGRLEEEEKDKTGSGGGGEESSEGDLLGTVILLPPGGDLSGVCLTVGGKELIDSEEGDVCTAGFLWPS